MESENIEFGVIHCRLTLIFGHFSVKMCYFINETLLATVTKQWMFRYKYVAFQMYSMPRKMTFYIS